MEEISEEYIIEYRNVNNRKNPRKIIKTKRICLQCNIVFFRDKNKTGNFCNRSCASIFYINNGTYDSWRYKTQEKQGKYIPCSFCGKEKYFKPNQLLSDRKRFCSKECFRKCISDLLPKGPNHKWFKKGQSLEERQKTKQTLLAKYGIDNAYKLAKIRKISKPQGEIYDFLTQNIKQNVVLEHYEDGYYYDIFIPDINLVIEYNGDYWHCNPNKYDKMFFNSKKKKYAYEIWENDIIKINNIKNKGYQIIIIWEEEYKKEKNKVLDKLINITYNHIR